jgi:hypothetical protein
MIVGGLTHGEAIAFNLVDRATGAPVVATWEELRAGDRLPIRGGSDASDGGDSTVHSTDMAPHTPRRSGRPGRAVALLDNSP